MAKPKCKPSPKVSNAGTTLATSKSEKAKSKAGGILVDHKNKKHK